MDDELFNLINDCSTSTKPVYSDTSMHFPDNDFGMHQKDVEEITIYLSPTSFDFEASNIWSISDLLENLEDKTTVDEVSPAKETFIPNTANSVPTNYNFELPSCSTAQSQTMITENEDTMFKAPIEVPKIKPTFCSTTQSQTMIAENEDAKFRVPKAPIKVPAIKPTVSSDVKNKIWKKYTWTGGGMEGNFLYTESNCSEKFMCASCALPYKFVEELCEHQMDTHLSFVDRINRHQCPMCRIQFMDGDRLRWHCNLVHPFSCAVCGFNYLSQRDLEEHIVRTHSLPTISNH